MNVGKLDRRVTFQASTKTRNSVGGFVETWADYASRWAWHRQMKVTAELSADMKDRMFYGEGDTVFVIRFDDNIHAEMRLSYDGNLYSIEGIREFGEGRQVYMEISAKRKQ